ncbi:uncharacterized protein LOC112560025 isoform X2 [Pomacea canaliculata]|uniref:uncharacterized protein LOC112560025 isoform X2 n=1 Tax=Pomacea canaliculata TaxID=400727 RepID=UPI000D73AEE0|nr:uncharacterized protein LOC112560025 isoform X2 [Pomacea canaliculata]
MRSTSDEGGHCSLSFVSCYTVCHMFRRLFAAISNSVPVTLRQVHCFDRSWFCFPFPSPPSMGFLATLISVAAILWCLLLSSCVTSADSDICYQGYTGPDSGGSCTFSSSGFCNYQRTYKGAQWEVNKNREAFVNMYGKDEGNKAVLTSPWMCGDNITTICIQFNFMFNCRDGGRLTLKLCHVTTGCHVVWFADSEDKEKWKWHQARENIAVTKRGQFQIQFEGEKTHDYSIYTETNFYLDNIVYNNASCFTDSTSAPPPTSDDLLSTLVEEDNNKENQNANDEEESPKLIMIATILAVLLLVAAVVVVVLYFRRQRADGVTGSTKRSVTKDHESSIVMVNNDVYSISGQTEGDNHTEDGIPLHEMGTPQDHTYYCMVHTLHPEPDPDVLVVHGRDNLSGSENYENFTLDKSNVKPPQSILGISSQT